LKKAGYKIASHWSTETHARFGEALPDAVVISLDRLPSHGRAVAEWFVEAKKRQHIPIIFAGGQSDKVQATKAKFPQAAFCATEELAAALERALQTKIKKQVQTNLKRRPCVLLMTGNSNLTGLMY